MSIMPIAFKLKIKRLFFDSCRNSLIQSFPTNDGVKCNTMKWYTADSLVFEWNIQLTGINF